MKYIVKEKLEKSSGKCPYCGKTSVLIRRFKNGPYWMREFKCSNGHVFQEVQ